MYQLDGPALRQLLAFAIGLAAISLPVSAAPCDIYWSGGNACVAAHSTTRSLLDANSGPLYQVQRGDGATEDIPPLSTGGVANAAIQDSFCHNESCVISIIYDQSGHNNHLTRAGPGSSNIFAPPPGPNGYDLLANATLAPVTIQGHKAYGVYIPGETGYRNDATTNVPVGDEAEGMYALFDGRNYNRADHGCCFDYGNAERNNSDNGPGTMEALYFGRGDGWSGSGTGNGPWIMADLENNLFSGGQAGNNPNPSIPSFQNFVFGSLKGEPNQWSLRSGDGSFGDLDTLYSGPRPSGYTKMYKEGAIILGVGGDNSYGGKGTFYEGVMVTGYPSDDTENRVHANVISQEYVVGGPLPS